MHVSIKGGRVTVTSETKREARALISLALDTHADGGEVERVQVHYQKAKRAFPTRAHKVACRYCHRECKNARGRSMHEKRAHSADATIARITSEAITA